MYNSYPRYPMNNNMMRPHEDRLIFPFLTGALIGGAAIGLTRPRPVFVNPGFNPGFNPGYYPRPYGYYNYGYYRPY